MTTNLAIITLKEKFRKISKKDREVYYLLTYNLQKSLTDKYFKLTNKQPTLKTNRKPLFLFNNNKKWANSLKEGEVYLVEYFTRNKYLHVEDWRILGDKLSIERSWNLLLDFLKNVNKK